MQNILLTSFDDEKSKAKLGDLGLAKYLGPTETSFIMNTVVGTEGFMAPEVHALYRRGVSVTPNKHVSLSADVWSLGFTLYGLACGGREELMWSKDCLGCDQKPLNEAHFNKLDEKLGKLPAGRCKHLVVSALKREPSMRPTASDLGEMGGNDSPRGAKSNRGRFYSYVIVSPSSVLTVMTAGRRTQIRRMHEIEHQLKTELNGWLLDNNFPIALSDAEEGCVRADVTSGQIHSLVWFAHGAVCWEPHTEPEGIRLRALEEVLRKARFVPPIAIIGMKFGARAAAERLHAAGISRVFWIRASVIEDGGAELFANTIAPVLTLLDATAVVAQDLEDSIETLAHHEWGLVQNEKARVDSWTPLCSEEELRTTSTRSWLHFKAPPEPFSNIDSNMSIKLTVLACDMSNVVNLSKTLCTDDDDDSHIFVSDGADLTNSERCRSVALAACESFMLSSHAKFEAVYRIGSASDVSQIELPLADVSKTCRLLLWIDLGDIDEPRVSSCISSFLVRLDSRFRHVSCVMTCGGASMARINETFGEFREFPIGDVIGIPGVTAASLHDEIKITTNLNLLVDSNSTTKKLRRVVENVIGQPIAGLYHDDVANEVVGPFTSFIRVHITDVGYLHKLRDRVLIGTFEQELMTQLQHDYKNLTVTVDKSHFAARYEDSILSLDSLTPHQTAKLAQCREAEKSHIHIRAPAGAGKTFIALYLMLQAIKTREVDAQRILFVAPKLALTFFVAKWLWKRLEDEGGGAQQKAMNNLYIMAAPDDDQRFASSGAVASRQLQRRPSSHSMFSDVLQLCRVEIQGGQIVHHPINHNDAPTFGMVVVDESHHLYRDKSKREIIERHVSAGGAQRVLLSDVSQSQGQADTGFPSDDGITNVELTEVVRSSKRIVAGGGAVFVVSFELYVTLFSLSAMAFQVEVEGKEALTKCHHESSGPPLKTFLFDVHEGEDVNRKYAEETVGALKMVVGQFPGLDLDDRLAIIVPDLAFEEALKPLLTDRLASALPLRSFELVSAVAASAALRQRGRAGTERLILSPIDKMDGLERLIIIGVGLDTVIDNKEHDDEMVLETRSRLYRAFTRAHMMVRLRRVALRLNCDSYLRPPHAPQVSVVNQALPGGFLAFLTNVELNKDAEFDSQAALKQRDITAAKKFTRRPIADRISDAVAKSPADLASANLHDLYTALVTLKKLRQEAEGAGLTSGESIQLSSLEKQLSALEPVTSEATRRALERASTIILDATSSIDELKENALWLEMVHKSATDFHLIASSHEANALQERYERYGVLASVKEWYQNHRLLATAGDAASVKDVVTAMREAVKWHKNASRFDLPPAWVERLNLLKEIGNRKVKAELTRLLGESGDKATRAEIKTAIDGAKCQILDVGDRAFLARLEAKLQKTATKNEEVALRQDIWEPHNTTTEKVVNPSFKPMHAAKNGVAGVLRQGIWDLPEAAEGDETAVANPPFWDRDGCLADCNQQNDDDFAATLETWFPSTAWWEENKELMQVKLDDVFLIFPDGLEKPVSDTARDVCAVRFLI